MYLGVSSRGTLTSMIAALEAVSSRCFTDNPKTRPDLLFAENLTPNMGIARPFSFNACHGNLSGGEDLANIREVPGLSWHSARPERLSSPRSA